LKGAAEWLKECTKSTDVEIPGLAWSILAKLSNASKGPQSPQVGKDLLKAFKNACSSKNERALLSVVEGLAFSSTTGKSKEELAHDIKFLKSLMEVLKTSRSHSLTFGCLSILVNLTTYLPSVTEKEKTINELRRLAKEDVPTADELDDKTHVDSRCNAVVRAGLLPTLNTIAPNSSPTSITAIGHILLSVATPHTLRGAIAGQGAIKLELSLLDKQIDENTELVLTNAMAKILISVDPNLAFSSRIPITAPIQPLTNLLKSESLPDMRPRVEALLALTNLASADDSVRNIIVDKAWTITESFLLSDTLLIQRSATELVCNLVVSQKGADKFIPAKTAGAVNRLHLLLALADVEDLPTRRAAAGALAMLTDLKKVCIALGKVERGFERVGRIVGDDDEDVAFRGAICLRNLLKLGGNNAKGKFIEINVSEKARDLLERTGNAKLKDLCKEVMGLLA
jgi:protein unc-45